MTPAEQVKEQQENKNQQPPAVEAKVGAKLDTTELKTEVKNDNQQEKENTLTEDQNKTKEELEADIAKGMKVSEAVGKRSTRLDSMDAWCNLLPFVGDASSTSASMLFFIVQNQKLAKKYRLPLGDKFTAALLQAGDRTLKTIIKAPLNAVMSIPVIGWLSYPVLAPINATVGFISDKIFKDNKLTAKLFNKSFENMIADAKKWNEENPDKKPIDVASMEADIAVNMAKIGKMGKGTPTKEKEKEKEKKSPETKEKKKDKEPNKAEGGTSAPTTEKPKDTPEAIVTEEENKTPTSTPNNVNTTDPNITSVNYEYVDKK